MELNFPYFKAYLSLVLTYNLIAEKNSRNSRKVMTESLQNKKKITKLLKQEAGGEEKHVYFLYSALSFYAKL